MSKLEFERYKVNARKDLIHFVEEYADKEVYRHIGENPERWIDELCIISQDLTKESMIRSVGFNQPPINKPDFRELGNGIFLYRGQYSRLRGLWMRKDFGRALEEITGSNYEWTHIGMGTRANLEINREFSDIPYKQFLPENFESIAKPVEKEKGLNKRPLFTFLVRTNGKEITVYAKGADISFSYYYKYAKPSYRLTSIASISKTTSKKEMETTLELRNLGVKVPKVIGYYEAPIEEFLFLEEIAGKHPNEILPYHKQEIIKQDAEMLAALCLAGYRKIGFTDFDDKIFDGNYLYLIDVDECRDLYYPRTPDYRKMLLNPTDIKELRTFRRFQRKIFERTLRDAIYNYRDSLTPCYKEKTNYVRAFYQRMGWKNPSERQAKKLVTFPKNYQTFDSWMSMMCDTN